jgi:hypothetical protein
MRHISCCHRTSSKYPSLTPPPMTVEEPSMLEGVVFRHGMKSESWPNCREQPRAKGRQVRGEHVNRYTTFGENLEPCPLNRVRNGKQVSASWRVIYGPGWHNINRSWIQVVTLRVHGPKWPFINSLGLGILMVTLKVYGPEWPSANSLGTSGAFYS